MRAAISDYLRLGKLRQLQTMNRSKVALFVAQLCLASLMVVGREALYTIPPGAIVLSRLVGGWLLFLLLTVREERAALASSDRLRLVFAALFGAAANQMFFLYGLQRTTATNASILSTSIPVLTLAIAVLSGAETINWKKVVGVLTGLGGAGFLVLSSGELSGENTMLLGNVMIGANCVCWALFLIIVRPLSRRYPVMFLAARLFAIGTVMALPISLPDLLAFVPDATLTDISYIVFIVLVPTVGAYALNQLAIRRLDSSVVAAYWYLLPVFGVAGAALRLDERLGLDAAAAALAICLGILVSSHRSASAETHITKASQL